MKAFHFSEPPSKAPDILGVSILFFFCEHIKHNLLFEIWTLRTIMTEWHTFLQRWNGFCYLRIWAKHTVISAMTSASFFFFISELPKYFVERKKTCIIFSSFCKKSGTIIWYWKQSWKVVSEKLFHIFGPECGFQLIWVKVTRSCGPEAFTHTSICFSFGNYAITIYCGFVWNCSCWKSQLFRFFHSFAFN